MTRDMTCIICPRGCALKVEINGDNITVTGNGCPKGKQYAIDECTTPRARLHHPSVLKTARTLW